MAWLLQGVLNAGLQILLSIFGGWLCARLRLVDPEVMSRNVNLFAMKAAYPAFIIHLLGVKTDLRDGEAWKALGVFVLWVFIIHLACYVVHRLRGQRGSVLQLGLNCLLLTTNNTGCIGWPVLIATVGQQSAVLSMLLGVLFFIQLLPVSICCFEYHKWQQTEGKQLSKAAGCDGQLDDLHAADQLPVARHGHDSQQQLALPAAANRFPHEFRYCYWSNELYQPHKPSSPYSLLPGHGSAADAAHPPPAALVEVCVESGGDTEDEAADHHCYGGGGAGGGSSSRGVSRSSTSSSLDHGHASAAAAGTARPAPGREWWRSGRPSKPQAGLKRAKDSCDSLYTPFAAAAAGAKQQAELEQQRQQQQQRPSTLGLSSLTRRLSRGFSAVGAAAATAAAAAVASPKLAHAVSLHTATSPAAAPAKRAASLKPSSSLRRQAGRRDPLCQMSMPLMAELSEEAPSCCPTHRTSSPPVSPPPPSTAAAAGAGSSGAGSGTAAGISAGGGCDSSTGGGSSSSSIGCNSSEGGASGSRSGGGGCTYAPAEAAAAAASAQAQATAPAGWRDSLPGLAGHQPAADSAIELHFMCESLANDGASKQQQQQGRAALASVLPPVQSFADLAARGVAPSSSAVSLHTLEDSCSRNNSDTGRISSRTNLLPAGGLSSHPAKGASKLGQAVPNSGGVGNSGRSAGSKPQATQAKQQQQQQRRRQQRQPGQSVFRRFVHSHPLLCHIVWTQMQSFHLWLNLLAIALSVSGARRYLDPQSPQAIPALGFVDGVLSWFSAACIPTLLFANGVWMCGKDMWCGGWKGQLKVLTLLLLKLTLLPALMVGLTQLCNIRGEYGLSLVLLASCPLAPLAFLVCQQYGFGAELATSITIQGVLLMLPQMMAFIKINQLGGLYDVPLLGA